MKIIAFIALFAVAALAFDLRKPFQLKGKRSVGDVVFTPAKLPCAYSIHIAMEITQESYTMTADEMISRAKDLLLLNYTIKDYGMSTAYSYRFDLEQSLTVPVYEAYSGSYCQRDDKSEHEAKEEADSQVALFTEKNSFDGVDNTVFQGKPCKVYYLATDDEHVDLYVDDNDYIIGEYYYTNDKTSEGLATFKYDFNVPMGVFALDRTTYSGCEQKAYSVPPQQC